MSALRIAIPAAGICIATAVGAGERDAAAPGQPAWEFAATAYPTSVRQGRDYTSAIVTAARGSLHLEARVDYESVGARSAFVGWTFAGGDEFAWTLRPLAGAAWGTTEAFVPALEASLAWGRLDVYVESEYVRVRDEGSRYLYAWSELGFRPVQWLRIGLAGQRTRAYGGDRDFQRGPFAQLSWGRFTVGGFWFNPGAKDQVFVASVGATF